MSEPKVVRGEVLGCDCQGLGRNQVIYVTGKLEEGEPVTIIPTDAENVEAMRDLFESYEEAARIHQKTVDNYGPLSDKAEATRTILVDTRDHILKALGITEEEG